MTTHSARFLSCALIFSLVRPAFALAPSSTNLEDGQARSLLEARERAKEVEWRLFSTTIDGRPRSVLLLGEIHVAYPEDLNSARQVIDQFEYLATENGPFSQDPIWRYKSLPLVALMMAPEHALLVNTSRRLTTSPMQFALNGKRRKYVANAEQLHVPNADEEANLLTMGGLSLMRAGGIGGLVISLARMTARGQFRARPLLASGVVYLGGVLAESFLFRNLTSAPLVLNRDVSMTKFVDRWIKTEPSGAPLMVIVGRAHLANMSRFLTDRYGFTEVPIDEKLLHTADLATR